uniref:YraN family protein n=1 Tax=Clostridium sp. NkU-1 TaxID=1095009 RepID=UPI0032617F38
MKNHREVGRQFEDAAAAYLESKGYVILERNYGDRKGEIDIIAKDGKELVFIEVKYRRNLEKGDPAEAVHFFETEKNQGCCQEISVPAPSGRGHSLPV